MASTVQHQESKTAGMKSETMHLDPTNTNDDSDTSAATTALLAEPDTREDYNSDAARNGRTVAQRVAKAEGMTMPESVTMPGSATVPNSVAVTTVNDNGSDYLTEGSVERKAYAAKRSMSANCGEDNSTTERCIMMDNPSAHNNLAATNSDAPAPGSTLREEATATSMTSSGSNLTSHNATNSNLPVRIEGHIVDLTRLESSSEDRRSHRVIKNCNRRYSADSVMMYLVDSSSDEESPREHHLTHETNQKLTWSATKAKAIIVRKDIQQNFKPIFDKHNNNVTVSEIKKELSSERGVQLLSRHSIAHRLQKDITVNSNTALSYEKFHTMMTGDLKRERRRALRLMMKESAVTVGVMPMKKQEEFLAHYTCCPPPLFIPIITLIQLAVFIAYAADMSQRGLSVTAEGGFPYYSPLHYASSKRWQAWRFLTYTLVHSGYLHLIGNILVALVVGVPLEMVQGWWRVAIIYLTGVFSGSLAHSVADSNASLVGASGGVYAILGAHLAAIVTNWKEMNYRACSREEFDGNPCCSLGRMLTSAWCRLAMFLLFVVPDFSLAIVRRVSLEDSYKVGVTAHIGGFLAGLFIGIRLLKNLKVRKWEKRLEWITVAVFLFLIVFAVFFNIFFTARFNNTDWS